MVQCRWDGCDRPQVYPSRLIGGPQFTKEVREKMPVGYFDGTDIPVPLYDLGWDVPTGQMYAREKSPFPQFIMSSRSRHELMRWTLPKNKGVWQLFFYTSSLKSANYTEKWLPPGPKCEKSPLHAFFTRRQHLSSFQRPRMPRSCTSPKQQCPMLQLANRIQGGHSFPKTQT